MKPAAAAAALLLLVASCSASEPELPPVELPPSGGKFDYQIGGVYQPEARVKIVVRDRGKSPVGDRYNICYLNALQTQPDPMDGGLSWWRQHHGDLLVKKPDGEPVIDPEWDEGILDISTADKRGKILEIQKKWIDGCKTSRYQAIEADNLDSHTRAAGAFDINATKEFMKSFVRHAHEKGLAVAQKNGGELGDSGKKYIGFDFAITEDCQANDECAPYADAFGDKYFQIEYTDEAFRKSCTDRGGRVSVIRRDRAVVPYGHPDYVYEACPPA
ncbi:Glycoside-hydrolase family GH114 [Lentzea xinjiangensis]|uniref:Glycoside-hydrolase family GH114 n=1 Tax=Lentzea xinjiangensis TaxID=402600 RepID=A0A1H9F098_9PSEU|nr:endo alpha-1,4 polygalactosaminidase [Lentzea xinjiangensis]SEQ30883.1 Glycoside-hydrolase family GH114 [Lentzea xinjiangensis]